MKQNHAQIDTLLRDWSKRNAAAPEQLGRLQQAAREIIAAQPMAHKHPRQDHQAWRWCRYVLAGAASLAAALLIAINVRTAARPDRAKDISCSLMDERIPSRILADADIQSSAVLASAMQALFAHEWRWVAQSGGNIEISVAAPNEVVRENSARPVMVRLIMMTRPRGDEEWRTTWETDVLMHSEDFLDFQPDPAFANHLQLWVYPLGDGKLAVDTGIEIETPIRVATQIQNLICERNPVEILALSTDAADYRVMQAVVMLDVWEG